MCRTHDNVFKADGAESFSRMISFFRFQAAGRGTIMAAQSFDDFARAYFPYINKFVFDAIEVENLT